MEDRLASSPDSGHQRLHGWFGLSYASFLTMPRVLMMAMPDEWQGRMAALLDEYDAAFPNRQGLPGATVRGIRNGKLVPLPAWLLNYRYPKTEEINKLRPSSFPRARSEAGLSDSNPRSQDNER